MNKLLTFTLVLSSLAASLAANDAFLSAGKSHYRCGEQISIEYANLAEGTSIFLYQNAALLPMATFLETESENGTFLVGDTLEQGRYRVEAVADETVLATTMFEIEETEFANEELNLMLMTDIHVMHPNLIISEGKAIDDVIASDRKMLRQSAEIFSALLDSIERLKPQILLVPGDMTKDGEKISHEMVAAGLKSLEEKGIDCFVVPGNHDVFNKNAYYFDGDNKTPAEQVSDVEFMQIYGDFGYDAEQYAQDSSSMSYVANLTPSVTMIGIDATQKGSGNGYLRPTTLQWVLDRADEAKADKRMVFAIMHHHLIEHFNEQSRLMTSAAIAQGDSIAQLFIQHGINLVFTGHMHISNISVEYNENKTDSLVEVSTGAPVTYPCPYRWITFNPQTGEVGVNTRNIHALENIPDMQEFSREEIASRTDKLIRTMVLSYATKIVAMKSQMAIVPQMTKLVNALPDDPNAMADMLIKYMHDAFQLAILTTSEANENLKLTERIVELVYAGYDNMIDDLSKENSFSMLDRIGGQVSLFRSLRHHQFGYGIREQNQRPVCYAAIGSGANAVA